MPETANLPPKPVNADSLCERGIAQHQNGQSEGALADLSELIRLYPLFPKAYIYRGFVHYSQKDYVAAIDDLTEAIRLDPANAFAYELRGSNWALRAFYEEAVDDLTEALRLQPNNVPVHLNRGLTFHRLGEYDLAIDDFTQVTRLQPEDYRAHLFWGDALAAKGGLEEAIPEFTEAIRLAPGDLSAYKARAKVYKRLGEYENADADDEMVTRLGCNEGTMLTQKNSIPALIKDHFAPTRMDDLAIVERVFPHRVRADLQRAVDDFVERATVHHFSGVRKSHPSPVNFIELVARGPHDPPQTSSPQHEEIDIGEERPVQCLKEGLWLLDDGGCRYALFVQADSQYTAAGIRVQVATGRGEEGTRITQHFFKHLEDAVVRARSYRGKVLSLESQQKYSGMRGGIKVHRMRPVARDAVILPHRTLELLDRNVIQFVAQRPRLAALGLSTKKGLLFYGPPGTGKTHTIHYLTGTLAGLTTLLISAEQIIFLEDYMVLARLLQPSMVVIEDVDLIGIERPETGSGWEQVVLNRLLNEMDGLQEEAEILFVLTTNRPAVLEAALASRPGRIDQAIEFPLPDEEGRAKLIRLYARGVGLTEELVRKTSAKTEGVSPAFLKELMRRAIQFRLERDQLVDLREEDVDSALDELLHSGGSLNQRLFGFSGELRPG